ncbi:NAD(P)-dependent oxidoreductase [Pantoea sp. NGS-ED-1003]|uniref:NAD-dependent epimerase/dehydratase family protein n=1 Tax=Pantoea sp. NGS-ED-1003 TaxID=1526743 RepID=UPI000534E56F|nr:NAD(P)-dependent oxidoreductase [Pantoea sp. NGS-ED-1003]
MRVKNILLTGASGRIGQTCFKAMRDSYNFTLTDLKAPDYEVSAPHRFIAADLSKPGAATELLAAAKPDAIVHLAGIPDADATFEQLLPANLLSVTWLLEAVAKTACRRFVFASSAQTIEGYPVDVQIHPGMAVAPANLYGVTKCYGEAICSFYATQHGLSCVALRIGAFEPKEAGRLKNARDYSAWLSPQDAVNLITCAIEAEDITFFIGYGISDNRFKRFDLSRTREVLGYQPADDAFREFEAGSRLFR